MDIFNIKWWRAIDSGDTFSVSSLLTEDPFYSDVKDQNGRTGLILASRNGQLDIVQLLCRKTVDINLQDHFGLTALIHACEEGHLEVAKFLLSEGANIDMQQSQGSNALMGAIMWNHIEIAKLLISANINLHARNYKGWSALSFALAWGDAEYIKLLLESGSNANDIFDFEDPETIRKAICHEDVYAIIDSKNGELSPENFADWKRYRLYGLLQNK